MNSMEILVRSVELVLMRHGVAEADLVNSHGVAETVKNHADNPSGVAYAIEVAVGEQGGTILEGSLDDADYLIAMARAL